MDGIIDDLLIFIIVEFRILDSLTLAINVPGGWSWASGRSAVVESTGVCSSKTLLSPTRRDGSDSLSIHKEGQEISEGTVKLKMDALFLFHYHL